MKAISAECMPSSLALQLGKVLLVYQGIDQCVTVFTRQLLRCMTSSSRACFAQQRLHLLEVFLHVSVYWCSLTVSVIASILVNRWLW